MFNLPLEVWDRINVSVAITSVSVTGWAVVVNLAAIRHNLTTIASIQSARLTIESIESRRFPSAKERTTGG